MTHSYGCQERDLKAETGSKIIAAQDQALQTIMKEIINRNRKYTLCQQLYNIPCDSMPNSGKKNRT
jgi:hypothetical protein